MSRRESKKEGCSKELNLSDSGGFKIAVNMSVTVKQFKEWLNYADDDLIVTIGGSEDFFLEHIIGTKVNIQFNHAEIIDSLEELEQIRSTLDRIEDNLNYFLGRD